MELPDLEPGTWVALAAAGVALLVGLIGPFVNAQTQKRALRAQREMANDDRLWAKRAALYEGILSWVMDARTDFANAVASVAEAKSAKPLEVFAREGAAVPPGIQVGLAAYASDHVNTEVQRFHESLKEMASRSGEAIRDPSPENEAELRKWQDRHLEMGDQMTRCMSDELVGKTPPAFHATSQALARYGVGLTIRTKVLAWFRAKRGGK